MGLMRDSVRQLLASFDALPKAEQCEFLEELLRCNLGSSYAFLTDHELVAVADQLFEELDRGEIK